MENKEETLNKELVKVVKTKKLFIRLYEKAFPGGGGAAASARKNRDAFLVKDATEIPKIKN